MAAVLSGGFFIQYLSLALPPCTADAPFCSSVYAETRNTAPETELLLQRGAGVLWFAPGGTLLVLPESWNLQGMCAPCTTCLLYFKCGLVFFPEIFFTHLGISLPGTVTLDCVVLEGFWQVIQSLLVLKGEISDCSYSLL